MVTATKNKAELQSEFYIVKTAKEAQKRIEDKVKNYNEQFVKKPILNSKKFIAEIKEDPIKIIDDIIDESKKAIRKTREEQYKIWEKALKNAGKDAKVRFEKLNNEGKKVYKGVENDLRLLIQDAIEISKKNINKLPMKKTLENRISRGIESIPSKFNLPSRSEFDNLVKEINRVKELTGLLPICSSCKKIRDDEGHWNQMEDYIERHFGVAFSHGICPDCSEDLYGKEEWFIKMKNKKNENL